MVNNILIRSTQSKEVAESVCLKVETRDMSQNISHRADDGGGVDILDIQPLYPLYVVSGITSQVCQAIQYSTVSFPQITTSRTIRFNCPRFLPWQGRYATSPRASPTLKQILSLHSLNESLETQSRNISLLSRL